MSIFSKKASADDAEGGDDSVYAAQLKLAHDSDLSVVENSGCVSQGTNELGQPVIIFIPSIGFGYRDKSEELLRQMLLLLIKSADSVVTNSYSIVYSHASINWLNQQPIVYEYYKMLPRKYKKNLTQIYVMHPQVGIRMFFEFARVFLSAKFYNKLQFVDTVSDFQKIIPPTLVRLPNSFLASEDEDRGLKASGVVIPLQLDFDSILGTTTLMARCATYIREHGGIQRKGLFRVAGDETLLSLVRIRLQPPPNMPTDIMRVYMQAVCIGSDIEHQRISSTATIGSDGRLSANSGMPRQKSAASVGSAASAASSSASTSSKKAQPRKSITLKKDGSGLAGKGGNDSSGIVEVSLDSISTVIVTDIDTVAQIIKMSLRDLPVPLINFQAYDKLLNLTKSLESKSISKDNWVRAATQALREMPVEHSSTLAYLLDFLREVAAESGVNQMDVSNLATVFAPTLLRPEHQDTTDMMKAFGDVRLCQVIIMNFLGLSVPERVSGLTTLSGHALAAGADPHHRLSTGHNHGHGHSGGGRPPRAPSSSSADEVGDINMNEKMLNRLAHLSVSNHRSGSYTSSLGRPAMAGLDPAAIESPAASGANSAHTSAVHKPPASASAHTSTEAVDEALEEELRRFDEEMEAANREHELLQAQSETRAVKAKRKSRRRSSKK